MTVSPPNQDLNSPPENSLPPHERLAVVCLYAIDPWLCVNKERPRIGEPLLWSLCEKGN